MMSVGDGLTGDHNRDEDAFFKTTWPLLGELGYLGFLIPAEYGGQNFSASEYTVAIETIAEYDPMAAYSINEHSTIGSLGLVKFGTQAQKKKYLPLLASGKLVAAFGLSEPEHGSDVTSITTSAVKKGNKYVLSGKKIHLSLAAKADLYTVVASVRDGGGVKNTMFLVERTGNGLRLGTENTSPAGYITSGSRLHHSGRM